MSKSRDILAALVVGVAASASASAAGATVSIPDTGIDFAGFIQAATIALGTIVGAVIASYFAFWAIKKGLKWMTHAG